MREDGPQGFLVPVTTESHHMFLDFLPSPAALPITIAFTCTRTHTSPVPALNGICRVLVFGGIFLAFTRGPAAARRPTPQLPMSDERDKMCVGY